jgi:hypothetical protein
VKVNLSSPMWQVRVPIQGVLTPISSLSNPNRPVVPLISHMRSYPPYCFQLDPPSLFLVLNSTIIADHKVKSSLTISPGHDHGLTLCTVYTEYNIHQVLHTPSTAYTEYSIHRVQHTPSTAYTKYSIHQVQHTPSTAYTKYSIH